MMRQENARSLPCFALRILWSAAARAETDLRTEEAAALVEVVEDTVKTALYNDWDESSLVQDSEALVAMGKQFRIQQFAGLANQLREAALNKEEREKTVEGPDPVTRLAPTRTEMDVDRLFQGLLDR
jgi:hypothetical protein